MFNKKIMGLMACDPNGVIGNAGKLPWHYQEELNDFYATTDNQIMVMGRKTFDGLPKEKMGNRFWIVFSREKVCSENSHIVFVSSLDEFFNLKLFPGNKTYYMIGGASIAKLFLEAGLLSEFLLTHIKKKYPGDTFFPLALIEGWQKTLVKETKDFSVIHYVKSDEIRGE